MRNKVNVLITIFTILLFLSLNEEIFAATTVPVTNFEEFKTWCEKPEDCDIWLTTNIRIEQSVRVTGKKQIYGQNSYYIENYLPEYGRVISGEPNTCLYIMPGANCTLFDIVYINGRNTATNTSSAVVIYGGGTLTVNSSNFCYTAQGIHVDSGAVLNFNSGSIWGTSFAGIGSYRGIVNFNGGAMDSSGQGVHNNGGTANVKAGDIKAARYGVVTYDNGVTKITSGDINSAEHGVLNKGGTVTVAGGLIHNNTKNGVSTESGTTYISGGSIYNNVNGVNNQATTNISGGTIYNNTIGVLNTSILSVSNGTIRDNTAGNGAGVYHNGTSCTITGGTFGENQNVYLAANDKFVITNSATPTFEVKPNTYTRGRKVVQTSSASDAINELEHLSLFPNSDWMLRAVNEDIKIWDKSTVTVKYLDESGKELASSVTTENWVDEEYTTSAKRISGYRVKSTPTNATGTYTDANITVSYVYEKAESEIEIQYVDMYTNTILKTKTVKGIVGDSYTITHDEISGYEAENSNNITVEFEDNKQIVRCNYVKVSKLTVNYIDLTNSNAKLTEDVVVNLKQKDKYTTESKTFEGYTLTQQPTNKTVTMERENITVTYGYKKNSLGVEVKYIDKFSGEEIYPTVTETGLVGDKFTVEEKTKAGYEIVTRPSSTNITMTEEKITITYEYAKVSTITVSYVDLTNANAKLTENVVVSKKQGDIYTVEVKTFDGYTLVEKPESNVVSVGRDNVTVTYGYKKNSLGVEVKYVDKFTGSEVYPTVAKTGLVGDKFTVEEKPKAGYEIVTRPSGTDITMTEEKITITYEYAKISTITVSYVDLTNANAKLAEDVVVSKKQGDTYATEAKTFNGYTLTQQPTNKTVIVGRENITVTYGYKKNSLGVEVKYIDKFTGEEVYPTVTKTGLMGDKFTVEEKEKSGYEIVTRPSSTDITMTEEKITMTYEYAKVSTITVSYVDLTNANTKLTEDIVLSKKQGDTYTTEEKTFEGYTLTQQPTNKTVTVGRENITVTYGYKKNSLGVEVKYIDKFTGEEIYPTVTETGLVGDKFTVEEKEKSGYEIVTRPSSTDITMTEEKIIVTYEYAKLSNVKIVYKDVTNNADIETSVKEYKQGDNYTTESKTFEGYVLSNTPTNKEGIVGREDIIVVYEYKRTGKGVTIKYIDRTTKADLVTPIIKTGNVGEKYTSEAKIIDGYELVKTPSNANGNIAEESQEVIYEYVKVSKLTIRYIDLTNSNTKLTEDIVVNVKEGSTYTVDVKTFNGYTLVEKPDNNVITMGRENTTVTYGYKKNSLGVEIKYVDKFTGEEIYPTVTETGLVGDKFTVEEKPKAGYEIVTRPSSTDITMTEEKITITYEYAKVSTITVSYVDLTNANAKLTEDIVVSKRQGDTYTVEVKTFNGYTLVEKSDDNVITMGRENTTVTYGYKKNSLGVEVKYVDKFTGSEVYPTITETGLVGDKFIVEEKQKAGYEIVTRPSSTDITMTEEKITVTYEYAKISTITVSYVDLTNANAKLTEDVVLSKKQGDNYTTEEKTFNGYILTQQPTNKEGTVGREDIIVVYGYQEMGKGVTIKYIDRTTKKDLVTPIIKTGNVGETYTSEAKTIDGYELVKTPSNANGNITSESQEVIYEYVKVSTLTVSYVDLTNTNAKLSGDVVVNLKEGDTYTIDVKTFNGYTLVEKPDNNVVTMERENTTIIYGYKKNSLGVEVKYLDKFTGEQIYDAVVETGFVGETFIVEEKEKAGYEIVTRPSNTTIIKTEEKITVTYEYVKLSNVKIVYKDVTNNVDIETNIKEYKQGEVYTTTSKEFEGYVLTKTPTNKEGTVEREDITVVYEYKRTGKGVTIKYIDRTTKADLVTPIIKTGNVGETYTSEAKTIEGYELVKTPSNANGNIAEESQEVIYEYVKVSTLTIRYLDLTNENKILTEDIVNIKEGDTYTIEVKAFNGYTLVEKPDSNVVIMGRENVIVTYGYKKNSLGVEVKYVDKFTGEEIYDAVIKTGFVGEKFVVEEKEKSGYEIVTRPSSTDITMTEDKITVIYEYAKISTLTVKYVDINNKEIVETISSKIKQGDSYTTEEKEIVNYELVSTSGEPSGTMGDKDIEIVYTYNLVKGKITITKVDNNDKSKLLSGAKFIIEKIDVLGNIDTTFVAQEKETGENGKVEFTELLIGKYRITEIKAPEGYELKNEIIEVEITKDNKESNILATNKLSLQLPATGSKDYSIIISIIGVSLMVIIYGYVRLNKKYNK